jgi:plasmid stabilization system protein ParE
MHRFEVRYTAAAREDLLRLFGFLLDKAQTTEDFDAAQYVIHCLRDDIENHLSRSPFVYRKAGTSPFLRELIIAAGNTGYVALYEIDGNAHVNILAIRHQREDDYH